MENCPLCNKDSSSTIGLRSHIFWKHYKKKILTMGFFAAVFFFLLGIFVPIIVGSEIYYYWDKIILHKEPRLLISIDIIKQPLNDHPLVLNDLNKKSLINTFADVGIVPEVREIDPQQLNLIDPLTNLTSCVFFSWDNVNTQVKQNEIPPELQDVPGIEDSKIFELSTPSREISDRLEKCPLCIGYEVYGVNHGNRDIDFVNTEICVSEDQFIIDSSDNIESSDDHCVRIKKQGVIGNESFLGRFIVESNNKKVYYDRDDPIASISGKFISKGKEFGISNYDLSRWISGIIPNCRFEDDTLDK